LFDDWRFPVWLGGLSVSLFLVPVNVVGNVTLS